MNRPAARARPYLAKVAGETLTPAALSHTLPLAPLRLASVSSSSMSRNLIDPYPAALNLQQVRQLLRPPSIPILKQKAITLLRFPSESLFVP
ncbi:hypothetical protein RvY_18128 [Ramazzottius varieornatus]|uniref:Uncharacterized protein n=1 Tax=Ramazzottius varieornatus TaxID=947166 RepID=A0A1D1W4L7_RAMVA|nr:hypothetical protein RvY_18128 [Ramazzottius varieornatus]